MTIKEFIDRILLGDFRPPFEPADEGIGIQDANGKLIREFDSAEECVEWIEKATIEFRRRGKN